MAPRSSKGKQASSVVRSPSPQTFRAYEEAGNDFLACHTAVVDAANDLASSSPGPERKRFTSELGSALVSDAVLTINT
jgi:hypothetical protein